MELIALIIAIVIILLFGIGAVGEMIAKIKENDKLFKGKRN